MSRDSILAKIRAEKIPPLPHPGPDIDAQMFAHLEGHFIQTLESVGGVCQVLSAGETVASALSDCEYVTGEVVSCVDGGPASTIDLASLASPHELKDVNLAVLYGAFGVAENAAIWVPETAMGVRVLPFITQHLVLVVKRQDLVHTMHQAYERLDMTDLSFGVFISGPSKTADIEQSLVIGAHGARSLRVLLV